VLLNIGFPIYPLGVYGTYLKIGNFVKNFMLTLALFLRYFIIDDKKVIYLKQDMP